MGLSFGAVLLIRQGTSYSIRNMKWSGMAWISLFTSVACWVLNEALLLVDPERAYSLHLCLYLASRGLESLWTITVAVVILLAYISKTQKPEESLTTRLKIWMNTKPRSKLVSLACSI